MVWPNFGGRSVGASHRPDSLGQPRKSVATIQHPSYVVGDLHAVGWNYFWTGDQWLLARQSQFADDFDDWCHNRKIAQQRQWSIIGPTVLGLISIFWPLLVGQMLISGSAFGGRLMILVGLIVIL